MRNCHLLKIVYSISPAVTDSHLASMGNVTVQSGSNLTRLQAAITIKTTIHSTVTFAQLSRNSRLPWNP